MEFDLSVLDTISPSSETTPHDTIHDTTLCAQSGATLYTTQYMRSCARSGITSCAEVDAIRKTTSSTSQYTTSATASSITSSTINYTRIEREREAKAQQAEMYKAYQSAIVKSEALRCELLKGVRAGEDTKELLVKAAKIIALITGDTVFENLIS